MLLHEPLQYSSLIGSALIMFYMVIVGVYKAILCQSLSDTPKEEEEPLVSNDDPEQQSVYEALSID